MKGESEVEFREVELELEGHGLVRVKVLQAPSPSLSKIESARLGDARAVSDALRHLSTRLIQGDALDQEESTFLAESLERVAGEIQKYGKPFGYQLRQRRGRPSELTHPQRFRLGRLVDKLRHPSLYGLDFPPQRLTDSSQGPGVYSSLAEQLGVSDMTVRRAYEWYVTRFHGDNDDAH